VGVSHKNFAAFSVIDMRRYLGKNVAAIVVKL
jgi:hypothetical protein